MTAKKISVDVAIVGAGTAGLNARRAAKAAGAKRVVMIDSGPFGTTCARVGCMPSKLMIAAAETAYHANHSEIFGVEIPSVKVHGDKVMARVQAERDRFVGFVLEGIASAKELGELIVSRAKLTGPRTLVVDDGTEITFEALVVAAGTDTFVPPPFRGLKRHMLSNETVFEQPSLPESLLVVGIGVIGLELGQAMARLGVRTTLIGMGGFVGPIGDPELLAHAQQLFAEELDLHPDYELRSIEEDDGGVSIHFVDSQGKERREHFDKVLMATGRVPNLGYLDLPAAGVEPNERGHYLVDPQSLQLGEHPIFFAGDVNMLHPLLHEAADDGRIAGRNAARFPDVDEATRRTPLAVVFSDPQIAIVGGGYHALGDCEAVYGEVDFSRQGRSRVHAINRGRARIYADKATGRLLAAELVGPRVEHMGHLMAWAVQQGMTVTQSLEMPFYHPVIEEGIRTALQELAQNVKEGTALKCEEPVGS